MTDIVVAIPVLARPRNAAAVARSLADAGGSTRPLFICSPGDDAEIEACRATGAEVVVTDFPAGPGNFAMKTNLAARLTDEPWVFAGADDLRFHPGWAEEMIRVGEQAGAGMVGSDDLGNGMVRAGRHSTHSLFRRDYITECGTVDQPGLVYHEGYDHQQVDTEAYETAVARGCFVFARRARVEHLHPFWGKGDLDATYEKGLAASAADRALFHQRRRLWKALAA